MLAGATGNVDAEIAAVVAERHRSVTLPRLRKGSARSRLRRAVFPDRLRTDRRSGSRRTKDEAGSHQSAWRVKGSVRRGSREAAPESRLALPAWTCLHARAERRKTQRA